MKQRLLTLFCCLSFALMASSQASGGQITRPGKRQSGDPTSSTITPSRSTTRTYTVKEQYEKGSSYYDKGNYQEAIKWYTKAAKNGYTDAQSELGFMYLNGEGTPVNKTEAVKWLKLAGEKGDAMAQHALGYLYKNGDGVYKSESEANKWFKLAAPRFYQLSKDMMKLGNKQCVDFFHTVIDMNVTPYSVWSLFHLGAIYYYGDGGQSTDFSKAYEFFRSAVEKGNQPAMYYLGLCYEYGRGVPKDMIKAKDYYKKSGYEHVPSRDF